MTFDEVEITIASQT